MDVMKQYQIIYADPPWSFKTFSKPLDNVRFKNASSVWRNADRHYDCMDLEVIKKLPVKDISADNSILFLWVTFPLLNRAFEVIVSWGFEYKTCAFVWVKRSKNNNWRWGTGYWTRANAELCLLATKGKPKRISASVHQIVETIPKKHSKKPDEVRNKIVQLMGDLPRIELFARKPSDMFNESYIGWDVWGNEVVSDIELK